LLKRRVFTSRQARLSRFKRKRNRARAAAGCSRVQFRQMESQDDIRCIGNCAGRTVRYLNISTRRSCRCSTIFIISTIYTPKRADWAGFNSCTLRSVCAWERVKTLRQCHATTPAEREIKALLRKHKTNGGGRNNIMTSCCCYSRPISLRHRTFDTIHEKIPRHTDLGKKSAIYVKGQKKK
jgi:hypothetical protein